MEEVRVEELSKHVGEAVALRGWLYHRRSSGKLHFLEGRDGTGTVQCVVFKGNVSPETFLAADHIQQESSIVIIGTVKQRGRIKGQHEIDVQELRVLGPVAREYPIGP